MPGQSVAERKLLAGISRKLNVQSATRWRMVGTEMTTCRCDTRLIRMGPDRGRFCFAED